MKNEGQDGSGAKVVRSVDMESATIFLREDGIIVYRVRQGARLTLDKMKKEIAVIDELAAGRKRPFMVDGSVTFTMDHGVREYLASPAALGGILLVGLLVTSTAMRLISNLYLTLNKPPLPVRLFNSETEAVQWLLRMGQLMSRKAG